MTNLVESVLERKKIGSLVVEGPAILKKKLGNLLVFIAKVYFCFRKVGNLVTPATGSKKPLNLKTQMVAPKFDIR